MTEILLALIIILFVGYLAYLNKQGDLLFATRQILLFSPAIVALINIWLNPGGYFASHMKFTQSTEIANRMMIYTIIALSGSHIGYILSGPTALQEKREPPLRCNKSISTLLFSMGILGAVVCGFIISSNSVPVWMAEYGNNVVKDSPLNNLNSACGLFLSISMLGLLNIKEQKNKNIVIYNLFFYATSIYVLLWAMLIRGARIEVVSILLAFFTIKQLFNLRPIKVGKLGVFILIAIILLGQIWGTLRSMATSELTISSILDGADIFREDEDIFFRPSTITDIAATFSGVLYFLDHGTLEMQYGLGYALFIPRTVPGFLWQDRPADDALIFTEQLGETSGGGFFELAQAYYNFGTIGIFVIPCIISFTIFFIKRKAFEKSGKLIFFFILASIISVWFRGILYQSFAFWRSATTAILVYYFLSALSHLALQQKMKIQLSTQSKMYN